MALIIKDNFRKKSFEVELDDEQKFIDMMDGKVSGYLDVIVFDYNIPVNGSYSFYIGGETEEPVRNINPILSGHNSQHIISFTFQAKMNKREDTTEAV